MKKKRISCFLALALCAGLATPALAAGNYEEITIEPEYAFEKTGKIIVDQAEFVGYEFAPEQLDYYRVPGKITLTVTPYAQEFYGTSRFAVCYASDDGQQRFQILTTDGTLVDAGDTFEFFELRDDDAYELVPDRAYTLEIDAAGYAYVDLLLGSVNDFSIHFAAKLRCTETAVEPQEPDAPVFTDVAADSYCAAPVAWAIEKGVTTGTSATTFSPDDTCTTAQILTFLWRANGSPAPAEANTEVPAGEYYTDAAIWALEKGLTDAFTADAPATRAATVTYLWKLAGKPAAEAAAFTDVAADAEYAPAVAWAVQEGITTGTSAAAFSPDTTCTRGQIVTFLYRDLAQ